jgi:N-methylhydantoinase B
MDDDGVGTTNIPIKLRITVPPHGSNARVLFDFTGSGPQVKGNINSTITATQAGVLYSLKALLDPDVPNNQGLIDIVDIHAPLGSIINAKFPAAVAARANTAQRIVDVVIGALAPAIPEAAVGAANGANTTAVFFGHDPRHDRDYVYLETLGGGFGGRFTKDGKDGVQVHITNTSNLPVESIEMEYPLLVESYGFVPDSGGAGKYRGGLGLRRVVRPVGHTMTFSGQGERFVNRPWGLFGGGSGGTGKFTRLSAGAEMPLPTKPANLEVKPDEAIVVETPGAGGYGKPAERDRAAIENDFVSGKFSRGFIKQHYGVEPKT